MKFKKIFFAIMFQLYTLSYAQHQLSGKVIAMEDNQPLSGASIFIKGKGILTTTNKDGLFSISLPSRNQTLIVSYVGFDSEEINYEKAGKDFIVIHLDNTRSTLQEVNISTGYQSLPKERATGSFSFIDNETFNKQVSTDILSRLEAVSNGLMVDRGTNGTGRITIRGLSTIRGPKEPLIIVDNFPYSGDINNLNPNDVENITILKDASAASIWGARAGNGVIVITTKKSSFNQPLTVAFNTNFTQGQKPDLFSIPMISSSDFIDVEQFLYEKDFYISWKNSRYKQILSPVVELLTLVENGNLSEIEGLAKIDALRSFDVRNDFNDYLYQKSFNQQYALSINGGMEKMKWTATTGYDNNIDNLNSDFERWNLRYQSTFMPIPKLQFTSEIYYTQTKTKNGKPGYGSIVQHNSAILPYARLADQDGNSLSIYKTYRQLFLDEIENKEKLLDWDYYPLEDYKYVQRTASLQDVLVNTNLNFQVTSGVNIDLKYQYERQNISRREWNGENSYYTRDLINGFTEIKETGEVINNIPKGDILDISNAHINSQNIRGQININHSWSNHEVLSLIGSELRLNNSMSDANRLYGYNSNILTFGRINEDVPYPHYIRGLKDNIPDGHRLSDIKTNYISYFGNIAYSYNTKYLASFSARTDASNLFGLYTNDQWNPFWSTGFSWILSNEEFFNSPLVPYLKFRASYGASGNIDPAMSAATTIQYTGTSNFTNEPFSRFSNYYNPELKWETSKMINLGLDFSIKNNLVSGSIEYFKKSGKNLFGNTLLDYTSGIGSIIKNVASMEGHGLDMELRTVNYNNILRWESILNLSSYKDKVTDYYLSSTRGSSFVSNSVPISGVKGKPVYSIFAYKWAGLDPLTGDPQGYFNNQASNDYRSLIGNETQIEDLKFFGSALPTIYGSFANTFTYNSLSLNFALLYKFGYYFRRKSIDYSNLYTNWNGHSDYSKRWQNSGDELKTDIPSMLYPVSTQRNSFYAGSEPLVEKGDHIRLQYVNLNYGLLKSQYPFLPFKNMQVYFNINNIGIIWRANKQNLDPDSQYGVFNLSTPRSYSLGIRVIII